MQRRKLPGLRKRRGGLFRQCLAVILSLALMVTMSGIMPGSAGEAWAADELSSTLEQPILLVSGDEIIAGGDYTAANTGKEKSYTLEELRNLEEIEQLFSAINTTPTRSIYLGKGISLEKLLSEAGLPVSAFSSSEIDIVAKDGYIVKFDPAKTGDSATRGRPLKTPAFAVERYYYPSIAQLQADIDTDGEYIYSNEEAAAVGAVPARTILAWERGGERGEPDIVPSTAGELYNDEKPLLLMLGQQNTHEQNNPLFNKTVEKVLVGEALSEPLLTIDGKGYTRGEILLMERAQRSYTYDTQGGSKTDYVRGIPLAKLLAGYGNSEIVSFTAADGYDMSGAAVTLGEAIDNNYILAYEKGDSLSSLDGIFDTAKNNEAIKGYFTLYGDNIKPSKLIDSITVKAAGYTDYSNSPYKHINNGGLVGSGPYNIDAITGATLTVEGPGVEATTPILMGDLERTDNSHIYRGNYSDDRGSGAISLSYEGVKVAAIIDGLVNDTVERVDDEVRIVFKNRWRQDVGSIAYTELKNAETPVILAYGTGTVDGEQVAPFVFDKALGIMTGLGNDDGCIKLVYDQAELPALSKSAKFISIAYIYVERGGEHPGFKHSEAKDEAYKNVANMEHIIAFMGSALGREANYTVKELEAMVKYEGEFPKAGGLGHRAEYGLSNTTYWYVNEYEGIKLWDLLTTELGLDANSYRNDENTLVSFAAWDNYKTTAKFSMAQLADPERFYFYEKSPLDIGTDRPSKAQLADPEYHPDNQIGDWVFDSNNYPVKKGYPVMLAYGVNGYPYVRNSNLPGFAGGLGNDGGPIRIIFGKADDMNRDNANAQENYAYFYNNGSNQLQRAQEIDVGDDTRYSTHLENPNYSSMKDDAALTVEIIQGGESTSHNYTLGELESILYGAGISKSEREKQGRQEKAYYAHKVYGGELLDDLFEGVNLWYLLSEEIGMPGVLGRVSFYVGDEESSALDISLAEIKDEGYNSLRGTEGLGTMLAFAKNGYPLVKDKNDTAYVNSDSVTNKTIKNSDGPLMFVSAQTAEQKAAGAPGTTLANLSKIVVNLESDVYAHTGEYSSYAADEVAFSGAVKNEGLSLKISDIEKLQKYMVTGSYSVGGVTNSYRGVDLNQLLLSSSVGASALLNQVSISNAQGKSKIITVNDMRSASQPIILAYGIGKAGADPAGKPLVPDAASAGYDSVYANSGGPLQLIIDGGAAADCIENVNAINVTASELSGWKHSTGYYEAYKDYSLELSGTDLAKSINMTVAELEALSDAYKVFDKYKLGNELYYEGIDLLKLLRDHIGFSGDKQSAAFTVYAKDNYAIPFTASDLEKGVNGKPIILAYGQGTSPEKGLPLVEGDDQNDIKEGFDPEVGNAFGPLRLIVNDNTGWCNKWVNKIVVGSAGETEPPAAADFNLTSNGKTDGYNIREIKSISEGSGGKATGSYSYTSKEQLKTDYVKGVYLSDLLAAAGISGKELTVTLNMTDGFESKQESYRDIPLAELSSKAYFLAYDAGESADSMAAIEDTDKNAVKASVRIYRNYDDGSSWLNCITNVAGITVTGAAEAGESYTFQVYPGSGKKGELPMASIREVVKDAGGGIWVGTNGGGAWYKPAGAEEFTINTLNSEGYVLESDLIYAIVPDTEGAIWFSQSKTYNPLQADLNKGVAYWKDGALTYYNTETANTIPNDYVQEIKKDSQGNLWFGSFGGLTKYEPSTSTWNTWDQNYVDPHGNSFPALSIDNLHLDNKGGMWIGFYPNGAGSESDPFVGGFAYRSAEGDITPYKFTAEYDSALGSSLLARVWVRDIAIDTNGGAWVVASGSYSDLANVGGTIWYVDKDGNETMFTGHELLGPGKLTGNSELRMVSFDADGGLWFGSSEDGVFYIAKPGKTAPLAVTQQFNGANNAWPDSDQFNNIYVLNIIDDVLYLGSNAGVMVAALKDIVAEASLIESFTIKKGAAEGIAYYVGGTHAKTFKGLPDSMGKKDGTYLYDGETHYVKGALLKDLLADAAAGENIKVSIVTSDAYSKASYENIPYADIVAQDYMVAYDVGEGTESLDKVADVDKSGVTASFRIYRNLDAGAAGDKDNRIKGVVGISVATSSAGGDPGGTTPDKYDLLINGSGINTAKFTVDELRTAAAAKTVTNSYDWLNSFGTTGSDTFTGIYLEDLLKTLVGIPANAKSVSVAASDGYYRNFNLDSAELGIYWTDIQGNKIMLAWERNGTPCSLQLVVGQSASDHINKPMWVSEIASITISSGSTSSGSGTPGSYESQKKDEDKKSDADKTDATTEIKAEVSVSGDKASSDIEIASINKALEQLKDKAVGTVEVDVRSSESSGKIKEAECKLPPASLKALITADASLAIKTDLGQLTLSPAIMQQLAAKGDGSVTSSMRLLDRTAAPLSSEAGDRIGARPIHDIKIMSGNEEITDFKGNLLQVIIPYEAASNENAAYLLIYNIDDKGVATPLLKSSYDEQQQQMLFKTSHLSLYAVGYNEVSFSDVQNHWAQDNILYLAARDILKGKGAGIFDPNGNVSRAEFVTMLANLAGAKVNDSGSARFADVVAGSWYEAYVDWAVAGGIVSGYGNELFGPNDNITREQMAIMLDKFIQVTKLDVEANKEESVFSDVASISSWADEAVSRVQQYGIISGRDDGSFAPQDTARRAEAATVIKACLDLQQ